MVEVADDGPGIPPEVQSRLFEPFFTTKEEGKGTGLGLDISYRIIQEHNGSIEVQSQPGQTRFIIRLPVR
jgi:signal transduction histidine kinase